jgi:formate hydrogenlyase transcriptional activator
MKTADRVREADIPPVLVVDDDPSVRESLGNLLRSTGLTVHTFATAQEFLTSEHLQAAACVVLDVELPGLNGLAVQQELVKLNRDLPIVFLTGHGDIPMTVRAIKAGAVEFLTKPCRDRDLLDAIQQALHQGRRLQNERRALGADIDRASMFEDFVGSSDAIRSVLGQAARVAPTDATVLILGESGTGKELIARAIHRRSTRSGRPFVRVNCGAIPASLVGSELFGHERGAFTGALQRRLGRFEAANGGTIFLDEVGDLPHETQVALLRVLQEREIERVGSSAPISVDIRVLAATNRDLAAAVAAGTFRQDLFYRLNVVPIKVPPLRERIADIPLLVEHLVAHHAARTGKRITAIASETLELFAAYDWPGNVRELQNIIERAVVLCDHGTFAVDRTWLEQGLPPKAAPPGRTLARVVADEERTMIERALSECGGRVSGPTGAASKLGIPRQTLESKIASLKIDKYRFRSA